MNRIWMLGALWGALAAGCGSVQDVQDQKAPASGVSDDDYGDDDEEEDEDEEVVALDQVPANVKRAAQDAVPGLVLAGAEKETEQGSLHYCLHGTAGGESVEVEVTPDGDVLEIERGDDDDDDD